MEEEEEKEGVNRLQAEIQSRIATPKKAENLQRKCRREGQTMHQ